MSGFTAHTLAGDNIIMSGFTAHVVAGNNVIMSGFTAHIVAHRNISSPATIYAATPVCVCKGGREGEGGGVCDTVCVWCVCVCV